MTKTHYREFSKSAYLASEDLDEELHLTVDHVFKEKDKNGTSEKVAIAVFKENMKLPSGSPLKGMRLNSTNRKILRQHSGSKIIEDWKDIPVTVFVNLKVKNPQTGEAGGLALKIRRTERPFIIPGTKAYDNAKAAFIRDGNFDAVLQRADISEEVQQQIRGEVSQHPTGGGGVGTTESGVVDQLKSSEGNG